MKLRMSFLQLYMCCFLLCGLCHGQEWDRNSIDYFFQKGRSTSFNWNYPTDKEFVRKVWSFKELSGTFNTAMRLLADGTLSYHPNYEGRIEPSVTKQFNAGMTLHELTENDNTEYRVEIIFLDGNTSGVAAALPIIINESIAEENFRTYTKIYLNGNKVEQDQKVDSNFVAIIVELFNVTSADISLMGDAKTTIHRCPQKLYCNFTGSVGKTHTITIVADFGYGNLIHPVSISIATTTSTEPPVTAYSTTPDAQTTLSPAKGLSGGIIAGIAIGSILGVALIIGVVLLSLRCCRQSDKKKNGQPTPGGTTTQSPDYVNPGYDEPIPDYGKKYTTQPRAVYTAQKPYSPAPQNVSKVNVTGY